MNDQLDMFGANPVRDEDVAERIEDELQKRDQVLDILAETRADLIAAARAIARRIALDKGRVSSPEVLRAMRAEGYGPQLSRVKAQFMGVVFRKAAGWHLLRYAQDGASHGRPVAIWELRS